ncbi:OsmC family protein [Actinosynnema sp. NPDC059335]|uniref:OsmC family protein n=1 Tax=Actinosynnema sp. NPDC059335 TaxID=3346804 RepID=UPI00366FB436
MTTEHGYRVAVRWTGNTGVGTANYRGYGRDHDVTAQGKPTLRASADPAFRGTPDRWNPEELLVASLSQCHMLTYLSLCARAGVVVLDYADEASGVMREEPGNTGRFAEVVLRPEVTVADASMVGRAEQLHGRAHEDCFIARSVAFPVRHVPSVRPAG